MADPDRSRPFLQGVEGLVQFGDHPVGHDSVRLQGRNVLDDILYKFEVMGVN